MILGYLVDNLPKNCVLAVIVHFSGFSKLMSLPAIDSDWDLHRAKIDLLQMVINILLDK